jgi:hypothetical protein
MILSKRCSSWVRMGRNSSIDGFRGNVTGNPMFHMKDIEKPMVSG